jgi:hypothetical protein
MIAAAGFVDMTESIVEIDIPITDARMYADRACSSLHLISTSAFDTGLRRLEADLAKGPVARAWRYLLIWGTKGGER